MNRCSNVHHEPRRLLTEQSAARVAELFRAFSDGGRVRILAALRDRELCVGNLAGWLGLSESAVSHQLRGLRQMRLVRSRRAGKRVYYRIDDKHVVAMLEQGIRHEVDG